MSPTSRPLAVVTGASSGIGLALAHQFASHGFDLVVAAEDDAINTVASSAFTSSGAQAEPIQVDLRKADGVEEVWAVATRGGRPVDAVAVNAGVGVSGRFATEIALGDALDLIALNVASCVHLSKLALQTMVARGEGRVLITSSVASTQPGPYESVYSASKSFLQSFAQSVAAELTGTGVTVTSLMPGPTDTGFFARAGLSDTRLGSGPKDDPDQVAAQAYEALMAGDQKVFAGGVLSKLMGRAGTVLPDKAMAAVHKVMAKPGSAN